MSSYPNKCRHSVFLGKIHGKHPNTGFLPEERAWIDEVVNNGYSDVFREFYPEKQNAYTYWDMKTYARERNVGWRIDYFFVSNDFVKQVKGVRILDDVFGSDHCPIVLELKTIVNSKS